MFVACPREVDAAAVPSQRTTCCGPFDDTGMSIGRACVFPWCLDGACGGPVDGLLRNVKLLLVRLLPVPTPSLVTAIVVGAPDRGLATGESLLRCCDEAHLKRLGTTRASVLADCHGLWSYVEIVYTQQNRYMRRRAGMALLSPSVSI